MSENDKGSHWTREPELDVHDVCMSFGLVCNSMIVGEVEQIKTSISTHFVRGDTEMKRPHHLSGGSGKHMELVHMTVVYN